MARQNKPALQTAQALLYVDDIPLRRHLSRIQHPDLPMAEPSLRRVSQLTFRQLLITLPLRQQPRLR